MWSKNTTTRLCGRHQKQSVIIIQVVAKITHAESPLGLGGSRRRAVRGRGVRAGRLRPGTSGRDRGGVRRGPRQLQASSVRHEQLEAIVSVDDRSERVRLDNRHSDVRVPTTAAIINQAQSEQNHSLTFRFRRYVVTATKPVHRLQMPQKCTTTGHTRHSASLHPGPCSSVRMRLGTDRQTYRQTDRQTHRCEIQQCPMECHRKQFTMLNNPSPYLYLHHYTKTWHHPQNWKYTTNCIVIRRTEPWHR